MSQTNHTKRQEHILENINYLKQNNQCVEMMHNFSAITFAL